jgi:hypothetical protein
MQDAADDLVDEGRLHDFGLKVTDVQVTTDLDVTARERYKELAEEQHRQELEAARIKGLKSSTEFYNELIQKGAWAALAVATSRGEISADELYKRLSAQERDRLNLQIDLLKTFRADNMRDEAQDYEISKTLADSVARTVLGGPALPGEPPKPQLTDASGGDKAPASEGNRPASGTDEGVQDA